MANGGNYFARIENSNLYFADEAKLKRPSRDYEKALRIFSAQLPPKATVLGMGSGDGRHLLPLLGKGYEIRGLDPSPDQRRRAGDNGIPSMDGSYENLGTRGLEPVDGVWCGGSLQHVPEDYLGRAFRNVAEVLKSDGVLFFEVELGDDSIWVDPLGAASRAQVLHQRYGEPILDHVLKQKGFVVLERWYPEPSKGRPGRWIAIVAKKG